MSALTDIANGLFALVFPPRNATAEQQYQHRVRIAAIACAALFLSCAQFAWDHGYILHHQGFARQRQFRQLSLDSAKQATAIFEAIDHMRAEHDADAILTFDLAKCKTTSVLLREQYDRRIQTRMEDYEKAAGHPYPLLSCGQL